MRRDLAALAAIVVVAFGVRVLPAWDTVFAGESVNFLETDAWYHARLAEYQVRNFPWRVTLDPYAAVGGQYVAIAPLFDTITAAIVVVWHGRGADTPAIERVAAFVPPVLGALSVVVTWALGRHLFGGAAGLLSAALLAVLPGHFLDRTTLGFVDHHALEACLALLTLLAVVRGVAMPASAGAVAVGLTLGFYLLGWSSGAFLVAILGLWLAFALLVTPADASRSHLARMMGGGALIALVLVVFVQDPRLHRYGSQVVGLAALGGLALIGLIAGDRETRRRTGPLVAGLIVASVLAALALWTLRPALMDQIVTDVGRLTPNPARMGVLEARPLFLYPGEWNWQQPWQFFGTGFYVGLAALLLFPTRLWRDRRAGDLLVWVYGVATLVATVGQNRFGYYLVTGSALLGGWLCARVLDWGRRRPDAPARFATAVILVGGAFAPNLAPAALLAPRTGNLAAYWQDVMHWLRIETPPPFLESARAGDEYYVARYPSATVPTPDYSVMNWWDQGYWLIQRARRVPVSNPTQERAGVAGRFYAETDERRAVAIARAERARYALADWELPFRLTPERVMGRFQSVLDWAGATHATYYEVYYQREGRSWVPLWVFHEPYYRSMAFRLTVVGGQAAVPSGATTVLTVADRTDESGRLFREVLTSTTLPTYEAALRAAAASPSATTVIVGLDPWRAAFPVEKLTSFVQVHEARTADQAVNEGPWVRVFRLAEDVP